MRNQIRREYKELLTLRKEITPKEFARQIHAENPERYDAVLEVMAKLKENYANHLEIYP
ncbi:MAG: hypothetical protein NZ807_01965 [Dehalococcoidia bacterium]|nr:hypothetical protein [Dehalococcoidia bacterium]